MKKSYVEGWNRTFEIRENKIQRHAGRPKKRCAVSKAKKKRASVSAQPALIGVDQASRMAESSAVRVRHHRDQA